MSQTEQKRNIILCAGGTGGHFFPAKALAEDLLSRGYHVHFFSDKRGEKYKDQLKPEIQFYVLSAGTLGGNPLKKIQGAFSLGLGLIQASILMQSIQPRVVIGFGGYPSFPGTFIAQLQKVPTILHEQNSVIGAANLKLAPKAFRIALSFPKTKGMEIGDEIRSVVTGNPVRQDICDLYNKAYNSADAEGRFKLFIIGGSLGAQSFSQIIPEAIKALPDADCARLDIVQQCRKDDVMGVQKAYDAMGVKAQVANFFGDVAQQLLQSHLVISRAGASTVAEIAAAGRPAIFVPYPHHKDEQQKNNARSVTDIGGGWLLEEGKDFTAEGLSTLVSDLIHNPKALAEASEIARSCGKPDAARKLGNLVHAVAQGWESNPNNAPQNAA